MKEAEKCYLNAIKHGNQTAFRNLGFLYQTLGDTINAEIYYKKAVEHEDFEAYNNLGVLCENKNRNEEAEKYYLQAMEKKQPQAISNLAFLYDRIGKLEEAEKYYERMLKEGKEIEIELKNLKLLPGDYDIGIAIADLEEKASYDHYRSITQFKVYSNIHDVGLVRLDHKFIVDNKEIKGDSA